MTENLNRLDEREFHWEYISRHIWIGRDDTEAIALVVCPLCMLVLLSRQCSKTKKNLTTEDKGSETKPDLPIKQNNQP